MIIAPHGAGLVNMLWAPNGTTVVELMHTTTRPNVNYWHLATALGCGGRRRRRRRRRFLLCVRNHPR